MVYVRGVVKCQHDDPLAFWTSTFTPQGHIHRYRSETSFFTRLIDALMGRSPL
jgi:hypothetical protein